MSTDWRAIGLLGVFAVAACAPSARTAFAPVQGTTLSDPRVKVVEAGTAPRRLLRYRFAAHSLVNIHSHWLATLKLRDRERSAPYFDLVADERVRIASVTADGSAAFDFEVTNATSELRDFDGREKRSELAHPRGSGVMDSRGTLLTLNGVDGRGLDATTAFLVSDCFVDELPPEPVGAGAKWQSARYPDWLVTLIYRRSSTAFLGYGTENSAPFQHTELSRRDAQPLHFGLVEPYIGPDWAGGVSTTLEDLSDIGSSRVLAVDEAFDSIHSSIVSHRMTRTECSSGPVEQPSKEAAVARIGSEG